MTSLRQEWREKQAVLPQPDVLLLAMGTEIAYRIPLVPTPGSPGKAHVRVEGEGEGAAPNDLAAVGWRVDDQWDELLEASYDSDAVRRAVDDVVRQYGGWRIPRSSTDLRSPTGSCSNLCTENLSSSPSSPSTITTAACFTAQPSALLPYSSCTVAGAEEEGGKEGGRIPKSSPATPTSPPPPPLGPDPAVAPSPPQRRDPNAAAGGRPAVSYGLSKVQSTHLLVMEVHHSAIGFVMEEVMQRLEGGRGEPHTRQRQQPPQPPQRAGRSLWGANGPGDRAAVATVSWTSPAAPRSADGGGDVCGGGRCSVRFEVQPRGPRGEWCSLYVLPAAGGKAAALQHISRRFGICPAAVVAAGDTDRDAELLAGAAGAAIVTATRPPPALQRLLWEQECALARPTVAKRQTEHVPEATVAAKVVVSHPGGHWQSDLCMVEVGCSGDSSSSNCGDGDVSSSGADRGVVVHAGRAGPAGLVLGLRLLGLL